MATGFLSLVLVASAALAFDEAELSAAATSSPRPRACRGVALGAAEAGWDRVRSPKLPAYCALVAMGHARLAGDPAEARKLAQMATRLEPDGVAAYALRSRAELALGRFSEAWRSMTRAENLAPHAFRSPAALHDHALLAILVGQDQKALDAYRRLAARTELLSDPLWALRIYLEAGIVAMRAGPAGLDEALGFFGEARKHPSPLRDWAFAYLALALDRQDRREQAGGVLAELQMPEELYRWSESGSKPRASPWVQLGHRLPLLYEPELHALLALVLEKQEPVRAREHYGQYVAATADSDPWRAHALRRAESLGVRSTR